MESVLGYLLSFSNFIHSIIAWAVANPEAAVLYTMLFNRLYEKLPLSGRGKDAVDAVTGALGTVARRKGLKLGGQG